MSVLAKKTALVISVIELRITMQCITIISLDHKKWALHIVPNIIPLSVTLTSTELIGRRLNWPSS